MTCGISNIVIREKPAMLGFMCHFSDQRISQIKNLYKLHDIAYTTTFNKHTRNVRFESVREVNPNMILQVWRNHKLLRPKIKSNWRYLFWEIDNKELVNVNRVIEVYYSLTLPLYYHESMRGYHFFSLKPVSLSEWSIAIRKLQVLNPKYPPITLRINSNKYPNEIEYFLKGHILTFNGKEHHDTQYFRKWVEQQDFVKLGLYYYLVWYSLENGQGNHEDKWSLDGQ